MAGKRFYFNRTLIKSKAGKRADLDGLFVRSAMEADVARMFEFFRVKLLLVAEWEYEPKTFYFTEFGYKAGPWTYRPDFKVRWANAQRAGRGPAVQLNGGEEWFEVKGREVSGDKTKAKRMRKHYPEIIITQIGSSDYRELCKRYAGLIAHWEGNAPKLRRRRAR